MFFISRFLIRAKIVIKVYLQPSFLDFFTKSLQFWENLTGFFGKTDSYYSYFSKDSQISYCSQLS